jgi:hypothetical protein
LPTSAKGAMPSAFDVIYHLPTSFTFISGTLMTANMWPGKCIGKRWWISVWR